MSVPDKPRESQAEQCHATAKQTGERCKNYAPEGLKVCKYHGGASPAAKAKHQRFVEDKRNARDRKRQEELLERRVSRELEKFTAKFGMRSGEQKHPIEHLLDELWLSAQAVSVLGDQVKQLNRIDQEGGLNSGREVHVTFELWNQERDRHARLAKMCLDAGVQERQVRVVESQAEVVVSAIRGVLKDLGVADRPEVPALLRKHLSVGDRPELEEEEVDA